jgi:hypothetical protein
MYGLLAGAALTAASAASAQLTIIDPTTVNRPPTPETNDAGIHFTFTYSDLDGTVNPFEQLVSFNNTSAGYYGLGVQSTATTTDGTAATIDEATDVDFSHVWITTVCSNAAATAVPGTCGTSTFIRDLINTNPGNDVNETYSLSGLFLDAGSYTIHIAGSRGNNSSFDGNLNFVRGTAPVPEPATWAMMLLGFGAVGWQMRRRRAPVLAQAA